MSIFQPEQNAKVSPCVSVQPHPPPRRIFINVQQERAAEGNPRGVSTHLAPANRRRCQLLSFSLLSSKKQGSRGRIRIPMLIEADI